MPEENIAEKIKAAREEYEKHVRPPELRYDTTRWDIGVLRSRVDAIEAFLSAAKIKNADGRPFTPVE
jgi:hypothetical protein